MMPYLTKKQISELNNESFKDKDVWITRNDSKVKYRLLSPFKHGMKGFVWRACDDLGDDVAIKIVPSRQYINVALIDEMTEASKLNPNNFAQIKFFGELDIPDVSLSEKYKAIATEWINGESSDNYIKINNLTVDDFMIFSEQIFTSLADLQNHGLCHDDLHPGNILIQEIKKPLTREKILKVKIIDTGSIKRISTRVNLLNKLREKIENLIENKGSANKIKELKEFLNWKDPDDHLRVIESLLLAGNNLCKNFFRLDFWERKFTDHLLHFFQNATDKDLSRRLDDPEQVMSELKALVRSSKTADFSDEVLSTPFDYISAEMIRTDRQFSDLFSIQCPWLNDCESLEPLYIYGPRGCGKSSVLRWLSFKTIVSDPEKRDINKITEVGIYVSCSVELRSRFWLFEEKMIDKLQLQIINFFNLILLEELFDTIALMWELENEGKYDFSLKAGNIFKFSQWIIARINSEQKDSSFRLQGQSYFDYLKGFIRKKKWNEWSSIQKAEIKKGNPDPSLLSDVCRALSDYFKYFKSRHITFLVDDYSNQRIPVHLQRKLNQTISFAKQGTPIFKVSSEYNGVDLEGIQEGREVIEINVGEKYSSLLDIKSGSKFLCDIMNIRLNKAKYTSRIEKIIGPTSYKNLALELAKETKNNPFYYHGIDCIHWLCSGDIALALDLIKKIFLKNEIIKTSKNVIHANKQHEVIQQFSHNEIRRIKYLVPHGEELYDIVCYLGYIARAFVRGKKSRRKDKKGEPMCKTHVDIRMPIIQELNEFNKEQKKIFNLLTSRAILISLETSRSRITGTIERLQLRRIFFPSFKAPLKRDVPIKIDNLDDLNSLLSNPKTFAERELKKSDVDPNQLMLALKESLVQPKEK